MQANINMTTIFILHLTATAVMTGLIWTIQLLHYPFFHHLSKETYSEQMSAHRTKISFIVIPAMLLELFTGLWLLIYTTSHSTIFTVGFVLIALIWLSTFLLQMPQHLKIADGYNRSAVDTLVKTNWVRTILWTIRLTLLLYISFEISFFDTV